MALYSDALRHIIREGLRTDLYDLRDPALIPFEDGWDATRKSINISFKLDQLNAEDRYPDGMLGFYSLPQEPDIMLHPDGGLSKNVGHVRALIAKLEKDLPGIFLSVRVKANSYSAELSKVDFTSLEDSAKVPHDTEIVVNRDSLLAALPHSTNPSFQQLYENISGRYAAMERAKQRETENPQFKARSYYFASRLTGEENAHPFIPVQQLPKLWEEGTGMPAVYKARIWNELRNPAAMQSMIEYLESKGIHHIALLGWGANGLAFQTLPDKQGLSQAVVVMPHYIKKPDSPFHLPPRDMQICQKLSVRIMPKLRMTGGEEQDEIADRIYQLVKARGLIDSDKPDIRAPNVGYYDFVDENGTAHALPMILDWDAGPTWIQPEKLEHGAN